MAGSFRFASPFMMIFCSQGFIAELLAGWRLGPQLLDLHNSSFSFGSTPPRGASDSLKKLVGGEDRLALVVDEPLDLVVHVECPFRHRSLLRTPLLDTKSEELELSELCDRLVKIRAFAPRSLDGVFFMMEELGLVTGRAAEGRGAVQRMRAQLQDWGSNFYDRARSKRVVVLSGVDPLEAAGLWVPDLVKACSAHPHLGPGECSREISWEEVRKFRPDVIVVAPHGASLRESVATFRVLEKIKGWEEVPAVKRGEVIFTAGTCGLYEPGSGLVGAAGILVSAIAGLDSGYISERDSFRRLRQVELRRHEL